MNLDRIAKAIVVSDFDGTIVNVDTAQVALELYADPAWKRIDEAFERGEVSFEDCLRQEFAMVRVSQDTILEQLDRVAALRPNFGRLVDYCMANGIRLIVASGGFDFCIQHFLDRDGWLKFVQIHAPTSRFTENGYALTFPKRISASSINFKRSVQYGLGVLATTMSFVAHKMGIVRLPRFGARGRKLSQEYYSQLR